MGLPKLANPERLRYCELMIGGRSPLTRPLRSKLWMLCTVIAVLGCYSIAWAQGESKAGDQTALAVPRLGLRGIPELAMPQPLSPSEAARIRHIFTLQERGAAADAARETASLTDTLLLGPILADRYLRESHPAARDLFDWLTRFGDQPEAPAIRALLHRVSPEAEAHPASRASGDPRSHFIVNQDEAAVAAAEARQVSADGYLTGGLAAWRLGWTLRARALFEHGYHAAGGGVERAGAAFWAARAEQRLGDYAAQLTWLRRAAVYHDTFYGMLAERRTAVAGDCGRNETLGLADIEALQAMVPGRRAFALLQVGQRQRAERELLGLWMGNAWQPEITRPLLLLARSLGMGNLANEMQRGTSGVALSGQAPPTLHPQGGFVVDAALVYGLVRNESGFRATAVSRSGARGLMQIKPNTAHAVAGTSAARLNDPAVNLSVGQQYLLQLADDEAVDGDLLRVLAGYGQGVNGLKRWVDTVRADGDPLLFLEAIPDGRLRSFIATTLVYAWESAAALHLPAESLDALAAGRQALLIRSEARGKSILVCANGAW